MKEYKVNISSIVVLDKKWDKRFYELYEKAIGGEISKQERDLILRDSLDFGTVTLTVNNCI